MEYMFYIVAIAFQLSGALLLIIRYWFDSVGRQLKTAEKKRTRVEEGGTLILGETQPSNSDLVREIWLNRVAFLYLAIGYIFSIWGVLGSKSRWMTLLFVLIVTGVLVFGGEFFSTKVSVKYKEGKSNEN